MEKKSCSSIVFLFGVLLVLASLFGSAFSVRETDYAIVTQFGKIVGNTISEPGLNYKLPFVQQVHLLDKRAQEWDGAAVEMPTKDKTYISVDTFARWRIVDPVAYFIKLRDLRSARSRIEDILGSETRSAIARHELIELVRTDKDRKVAPEAQQNYGDRETGSKVGQLPAINFGRGRISQEIKAASARPLKDYGIELLDVRIKRVNYNRAVLERIYQRMTSERIQIAQRFRSEGEGEAAKIDGQRERELSQIESEAYREVQKVRGEADAEASGIYAKVYGENPAAAEFYRFTKSLETFRKTIDNSSTLILSTDSDFLRLLKSLQPTVPLPVPPKVSPAPPAPPAAAPAEQPTPVR